MNIQELISQISKKLDNQEHAYWLLEAITQKTKAQLLSEELVLTQEQLKQIDDWVNKIVNEHYPIQYLIGSVPFLNCEILVEPPILIPRPETEEWVSSLDTCLRQTRDDGKGINILDMCTGSGCIAIAIARAFPQAHVVAVDISQQAISLAQKNIALNKVNNVEVVKSDLFASLDTFLLRKNTRDERKGQNPFVVSVCEANVSNHTGFDLIVSNPPYIDEDVFEKLDLSVKNWEDPKALICKDKGLFIIKQIIKEAPKFLKTNGMLVMEIDETQGKEVVKLMQESGYKNVQIKKDLYGKDRVVSGSHNCNL